jgi:hypothetical protein
MALYTSANADCKSWAVDTQILDCPIQQQHVLLFVVVAVAATTSSSHRQQHASNCLTVQCTNKQPKSWNDASLYVYHAGYKAAASRSRVVLCLLTGIVVVRYNFHICCPGLFEILIETFPNSAFQQEPISEFLINK